MNKIQMLNDSFRKQMLTGPITTNGRVLITPGIEALGDINLEPVMQAVVDFDKFDTDNDPYHEHDFGSFDFKPFKEEPLDDDGLACISQVGTSVKVFWKFDYYDKAMEAGSPDPSDPSKTTRVLTVMTASEY